MLILLGLSQLKKLAVFPWRKRFTKLSPVAHTHACSHTSAMRKTSSGMIYKCYKILVRVRDLPPE
jgi:hypothetical protein